MKKKNIYKKYKNKIFLAGHNGMVGSSIFRKLKNTKNLVITANRKKLDLLDQKKVFNFFKKNRPDKVIIAAAKVGGINANMKNKEIFLYNNLQIQNNLIYASFKYGVKDLIFLGSSCLYPKFSKQPIKEKYLLTGCLEETNDAYAIAKIAGLKLCEYLSHKYKLNYKTLMPNNVFGPGDNYDPEDSHFFAALIRKVVFAIKNKRSFVELWGSGSAKRELLYVDDLADACLYFLNIKTDENLINIGSGIEFTIEEYLKKIMKFFNVNLQIKYNKNFPDGMKRKRLDLSLSKKYGWKSKYKLEDSLEITVKDFLKNHFSNKPLGFLSN